MIWSVLISALLFISIPEGHGLRDFPKNFALATEGEDQVLTCDTTADRAVTWKFDGVDLKDTGYESNFKQNGQDLNVSEVEEPMLGNYSCWSEGQMLSSVYLLQLVPKESNSQLRCWAKSYDCIFNCEWTRSDTAVRVGVGPECNNGLQSCQWASGLPLRGGGFVFNLSHSLSPYDEEKSMLEVTAEAIVEQYMVKETKHFFLRDIIQPDSPQNIKCEKMGDKLKLTIEPPPTWSSPPSFFGLEHQTEYKSMDDCRSDHTSSTLIPLEISCLRVRSRDPLVQSKWSNWSNWIGVTSVGPNATCCTLALVSTCLGTQIHDSP